MQMIAITHGSGRNLGDRMGDIDGTPSPGPPRRGPGEFEESIRESKLSLNTSWRVLSVRGLAEPTGAGRGVETCILPGPIERVEKLHSEECIKPIRMHGNPLGQAQVFRVAGEFANRERPWRIAKGKIRCGSECSRIQSEALSPLPAAAMVAVKSLPRNGIGTAGGAEIRIRPGKDSGVPVWGAHGKRGA